MSKNFIVSLPATRAAISGDRHALFDAFPWAETPQGAHHWAVRATGEVALSEEDKAYLRSLVPTIPKVAKPVEPVLNTQVAQMLNHMRSKGYITHRDAHIDYGVQAFSRRMKDIRELGFKVKKEPFRHPTTNARYFRYSLAA